ncbi:MAG: CopG family transcriptional regulator [Tannerella sp.]|jgi:predicted RNase H-like HicB family nuclease|nr:CopG family transcriptional regulator [Tannerella sp.]
MEKVNVTISWYGKNYCASLAADMIGGVVVSTNKTLEGVKKSFAEALQFHIEGRTQDEDVLPEFIRSGEYELNYIKNTSALLHSLDGTLTRSAIARATGINERQIGHYASGHRTPRPKQRQKIIDGIHSISRELASVV